MTDETMFYLREKINDAESILREKQKIDRAIERITGNEFAAIELRIGEGKDMALLRFLGDRNKLVEILERRRDELLKKYEDL